MNLGDKITIEAELTQIGEGWVMVRVPKIGHHPPSNVRVPIASVVERPAPKARATK